MDYADIQPLVSAFHRKLAATDLRFKRYLYNRINWDVRLLGIKGARGVGKTTLLLQHIKETFANLDEVHKHKNWTQLLKNFYDSYPGLNIVYTGSAMPAIDNSKTDLSRRQSLYTLNGLSFREYLESEGIAAIPAISLEELLDRAALLCLLTDKVKDYKHLTGPKKVYLNNTNLMYALSGRTAKG